MLRTTKADDIDGEDQIIVSKLHFTKNEYNATVRNKLEYRRLKIIKRRINNQNEADKSKLRTSMHDLKQRLDDNQQIIGNIDQYFIHRKVQSATPQIRSRAPATQSTQGNTSFRAKSASAICRPLTAPAQTSFSDELLIDREDAEDDDDDEVVPVCNSQLTSAKQRLNDRARSAVSSSIVSHQSSNFFFNNLHITPPHVPSSNHRITWPVQIKVFALQDEDESRQQFLSWTADQRKTKSPKSATKKYDLDLEQKYQQTVRRRKEIESFVTPEIIEEHRLNDPVFAKRYRQLQLAIRAGKSPTYDINDREIHLTTNKSRIERTRAALLTAQQTQMKDFYRNQQKINDAKLSKRVDHFLKRLAKFKQAQQPDEEF